MDKLVAPYRTRYEEFSASYETFECLELRNLIVEAGERLAALLLEDPAWNEAMTSLYKGLGLTPFNNGDWRALWANADLNELLGLPLAEKMFGLHGYAFYGLSPKTDRTTCQATDIAACIESAQEALGRFDLSNYGDLSQTLSASKARYALDTGTDLDPAELADLAEISAKSMKNAVAPSSGSGLEIKDRKVTHESALRWLTMRGDYKESIWMLLGQTEEPVEQTTFVSGEVLFVPFAKDGTMFHPELCQRAGKYTVGAKGSEQSFDNYRAALEHLARMRPAAYWRRPNTAGNWGIVTAVAFRPLSVEELGLVSKEA